MNEEPIWMNMDEGVQKLLNSVSIGERLLITWAGEADPHVWRVTDKYPNGTIAVELIETRRVLHVSKLLCISPLDRIPPSEQ